MFGKPGERLVGWTLFLFNAGKDLGETVSELLLFFRGAVGYCGRLFGWMQVICLQHSYLVHPRHLECFFNPESGKHSLPKKAPTWKGGVEATRSFAWRRTWVSELLVPWNPWDQMFGGIVLGGGFRSFSCSPRSLEFHDPIWLAHISFNGLVKNHQLV